MRGFAVGAALVSCVVAISTYGCGGTTIDSGGTGTSSSGSSNGGSTPTGGVSAGGTGNTGGKTGGSGGQLGGGGSMGSSSGATGFGGVGGVSGFTGFGGASGFGGVGGTGGLSCAPPSCAGCPDCFSSCYCQTQNMNGCITKCSGGSGGTGGSGVGGTSFGGAGGSGGTVDCNALINDVYAKLDAAKTCCPFCNSLQCTASVDGPCCPETVNSADSAETQAYLGALKLLRSQPSCGIACPAIVCAPAQPSYNCVATASGSGRCQ